MKKVSVVIPTYNRARFLPVAVESIVRQDYPNIEIIIVDDGSTDSTESVVHDLVAEFPVIVYCKNERTKGPSGARNSGIIKASGEYVAFLDSDDMWMHGHLFRGVQFLEANDDVDVLFGNFEVVEYKTKKHLYYFFGQKQVLFSLQSENRESEFRVLRDNLFLALTRVNFFHLGTSTIKRSMAQNVLLDESIMHGEDRDFAIRLYQEANATFAFRATPTYILHRHDSNLTNSDNVREMQRAGENTVYSFMKYMKNYQLSYSEKENLRRCLSEELLSLAFRHRKQKNYKNAILKTIFSARFKLSLKQIVEILKILCESISSLASYLHLRRV